MRMSETTQPEDAPGHYGAGYGEQVPADAPPRPAPQKDANTAPTASDSAAGGADSTGTVAITTVGDDGNPVVFTPADVGARPPDHPPTDSAPKSEKASLIFERS
jgi:hypothetical protein